jgi:hypothetical protein
LAKRTQFFEPGLDRHHRRAREVDFDTGRFAQ